MHRLSITLTDAHLNALEVRGYLDPDRRGDRLDERDAIELFLADSLRKGYPRPDEWDLVEHR